MTVPWRRDKFVMKHKIKSVVVKGKRLPAGYIGTWALQSRLRRNDLKWILPYILESCGKPPYNLTIEVR